MVFVASYAVTFSWGAFFIMYCNLVVIHGAIFLKSLLSLYVVLFSLCAVANSLYAVPSPLGASSHCAQCFFRYITGSRFSLD